MSGCCGGEAIFGGRPNGGDGPAACCGFHAVVEAGAPIAAFGANSLVPAGIELFDEGGFYDTTTFLWTPPIGLVTIEAAVDILAAASGDFIRAVIFKNGVEYKFGTQVPQTGGPSDPRSVISFIEKVTGADTYQLQVFLSSAADKTIEISGEETYFSGACVGVQCVAAP